MVCDFEPIIQLCDIVFSMHLKRKKKESKGFYLLVVKGSRLDGISDTQSCLHNEIT